MYIPTAAVASSAVLATEHPELGLVYHALEVCRSRISFAPAFFEKLSPLFSYDTLNKLDDEPSLSAEYAYGVVEIPNGRLYTDNKVTISILTAGNTLLGDVSYQYSPSRSAAPEDNEAMRMKFWSNPTNIKGTVLSLLAGGGSTNNYGHWLIDALPRLDFIRRCGLENQIDYYLVPSTRVDYQRDSLEILGIPTDKIIPSYPGLHIIATKLITTAHPRGNRHYVMPDWIANWNRTSFLHKCLERTRHIQFADKIYVTRRDSNIRNVSNEAQVIAHLATKGYKDYTLAELPFAHKVALFANASRVVCVTGAGLNNIMFSKPGSGVVDIFPPDMVHSQYYQFAKQLGLNYSFLIADTDAPTSKEMQAARNKDVYIDIDQLDACLAELDKQDAHSTKHATGHPALVAVSVKA